MTELKQIHVGNGIQNKNTTISLPELVEDIKRLGLLLAMETDYLRALDYGNLKALQDEKLKLVYTLEIKKKVIAHNPGVLVDQTPAGLVQLKEVQRILEDIMLENERELYKAREVNRLVVEAIVDVVEEHLDSMRGYQGSRFKVQGAHTRKDMPSLTFNESV
ncbi:MAG: hypothetical protein H6908_01440 [Hyphomicrobiales bacterium]|nr:hypothetical protein [Rickettsiales bacterium]MCP5361297.1 hypothetical protein [Hyphomicrobiales bacterium]